MPIDDVKEIKEFIKHLMDHAIEDMQILDDPWHHGFHQGRITAFQNVLDLLHDDMFGDCDEE